MCIWTLDMTFDFICPKFQINLEKLVLRRAAHTCDDANRHWKLSTNEPKFVHKCHFPRRACGNRLLYGVREKRVNTSFVKDNKEDGGRISLSILLQVSVHLKLSVTCDHICLLLHR